ncbi:MAG: M20/M25/M40 family metallo-hydrolase [Chloroherpetonaceae bacterium]
MKKYLSFLVALLTTTLAAQPQRDLLIPEVSADSLQSYVKTLASDAFEGRAPGTSGGHLATVYVQQKFADYGLTAFESLPDYLQPFNVTTSLKAGEKNFIALKIRRLFRLGVDFTPLGYSSSGTAESRQVVFVGYGISTEKYDDYKGVDVKGKIVVMMRYSPDGDNPHSEFFEHASIWKKLSTAREKGAIGALIFTGERNGDDKLIDISRDRLAGDAGIPAMNVTRTLAANALMMKPQVLLQIQEKIDQTKQPNSFVLNNFVAMQTEIVRVKAETYNVVGYLPAQTKSDEYLVIGAHYDHIGYGGQGSGSLAPDEKKIHYGADDNASGSAGLLELARTFAKRKHLLKRNLVFIAFGAEEMGLLGSSYFVNHPPFPLEKTIAMLNMDMIGRMKDSALAISGIGTAKEFEELCKAENRENFKLKLSPDGFGPSDHSSFYAKNIPVLFFFTGNHPNYHKPSDTWEKINYTDEARLVNYVSRLIEKLDASPRPTFTKAQSETAQSSRSTMGGFRVSFGSIPNYSEEVEGVLLDGVREGSVAEKAGLKAGDIIIKMGEKDIRNVYDYTDAIKNLKPGDTITVVVKRNSETLTLSATFPEKK